jgi:hypothetical protein
MEPNNSVKSNIPIPPKLSNSDKFFSFITTILSEEQALNFLHITGANSTGKSILCREVLLHYLISNSTAVCYLIDTENKVSKQSFEQFPSGIRKQINKMSCSDPKKLKEIFRLLKNDIFQLNSKSIIVIDSISKIIKDILASCEDKSEYNHEINDFITEIIIPIKQIVLKYHCKVICTHHNSFNKTYEIDTPYFLDLMQDLEGNWLSLRKDYSDTIMIQDASKSVFTESNESNFESIDLINNEKKENSINIPGYLKVSIVRPILKNNSYIKIFEYSIKDNRFIIERIAKEDVFWPTSSK